MQENAWYYMEPQPYRSSIFGFLAHGGVGVEVGVWAGEFSAELLNATEPSRLYLVDPWAFRSEALYRGAGYGGRFARSQADMDQLYELVAKRFHDDDRVIVVRSGSIPAAAMFADSSLDWVYVDGDHSYGSVVEDLTTWSAKIRPGGYLAGDDYGQPPGEWYGDDVTRAVNEFIATGKCEVAMLTSGDEGQFVLRVL